MSTKKRKHCILSLRDKFSVIKRLEQGENIAILANEYEVSRATIYSILKNKEKIQQYAPTSDCSLENRLTINKGENPDVEDALYTWYSKQKHCRLITGELLAQKAKYFYKQMTGKTDFNASEGWCHRFKLRYGLSYNRSQRIKMSSEDSTTDKMSNGIDLNIIDSNCNDTLVNDIKTRFLDKIKDLKLKPSQVYNASVSRILWKIPHNGGEDKLDNQNVKEQFAIFPCTNATAQHCLKLLVIGRRPRTRTIRDVELPVHYYRQTYVMMTRELIQRWFDNCFVPEVKKWLKDQGLPQKALLLLANTDNLLEKELATTDKSIVTMLIPATCLEIQPMNEVSQHIKKFYKRKMMLDVLNDETLTKTMKNYNMKYMVYSLYNSWQEIHVSKIFKAWTRFWNHGSKLDCCKYEFDDVKEQISTPKLMESVSNKTQVSIEEIQQWYEGVEEEKHCITEEEMVCEHSKEEEQINDYSKEEEQIESEDVLKSFDTCLQWAEENDCSAEEISLLNRLKDKACQNLKKENGDDSLLNPSDYLKVELDD